MNDTNKILKDRYTDNEKNFIKSMIIDTLMTTIGNYTFLVKDKFEARAFEDLILSVIIIFNREIISRTILMINFTSATKCEEIIDIILNTIKTEALKNINDIQSDMKKSKN
jgi:hypothetical protein